MCEQLIQLFEEEVERRVNEHLSTYVEKISKTHGISIDLLLRDIPRVSEKLMNGTQCRGLKKDGRRCTRRGKNCGYCDTHVIQKKEIQPIAVASTTIKHTHPSSVVFKKDCPVCMRSSSSKELIGLDVLL
jgi:hypothetical protein